MAIKKKKKKKRKLKIREKKGIPMNVVSELFPFAYGACL